MRKRTRSAAYEAAIGKGVRSVGRVACCRFCSRAEKVVLYPAPDSLCKAKGCLNANWKRFSS